MTKTGNLRPTLPDDMDEDWKELISDCWQAEPGLRPSFAVILLRLQGIGQEESDRDDHEKMKSAAKELCRELNDLLWDYAPARWVEDKATALIASGTEITAREPTLGKILGSEKGPNAVKSLGHLMFGGREDGAEIRPEPVLERDIIVSHGKSHALLKARFSVIAPEKIKQWRVKDTREFDGLQAALLASEKSIESWGTGTLGSAAAEDSGSNKEKRSWRAKMKKAKRKKKKKKKTKKPKKDARVENFIKASRFVRGYGAAAIHPSAKIELHGLRMQALNGDCPEDAAVGGSTSLERSLQQIKLDAWRSVHGKGREEAMEKYLSLLTSLAPNWKVAHILLGRQTNEERRKPREMMWVLKVGYRARKKEEALAVGTAGENRQVSAAILSQPRGLRVTSIEILQSSNGANARLWSQEVDDTGATTAEAAAGNKEASSGAAAHPESEMNTFIAGVQNEGDFTLADCIIDSTKHQAIEEQREHYAAKMLAMARSTDGDRWMYYGKTIQAGVSEDEQ